MNILCLIGLHKYSEWKYVKPIGRYESELKKKCQRCGNVKTYVGLTKTSVTGEKKPL